MNDATLSPSWPSRQVSLVVDREGYDTEQGLNQRGL
jgi:hypothetical protein